MSCAMADALFARAPSAAPETAPALLTSSEFAPRNLFAAPPGKGSVTETLELQELRALHRRMPAARVEQAARDGKDERPDAFDAAAGRDLSRLPATMKLLTTVQQETGRIVKMAKRDFRRTRPYKVDPALPHCGKGKSIDNSYPSGHAGFAWSVGWTLSRLIPARAPQILARAQEYSFNREICGSHFPSDVEASHAAAILIADRLMADPRLADEVAVARTELTRS